MSALDLLDNRVRQARCVADPALDGPQRQICPLSLQRGFDYRIANDEAFAHEPPQEDIDVVEGGILPDGAIQPEGTPAGSGQCQPIVDELIGRQYRQARAEPKLDAEELSIFGD